MPGFLSPGKGVPLLLIPEYSGINKGQRVPGRSKTAHWKPLVKCFLTREKSVWSEISMPGGLQNLAPGRPRVHLYRPHHCAGQGLGFLPSNKITRVKTLELFFSKAYHRKSQEDKKDDFLPLKWL